MNRHRAAIVGVLLALVAAGCGGDPAPPESGPIGTYVALGDSYAAGPGIPPEVDADCRRSGANYASLIAERLEISDLRDVSCGGARTSDLRVGQVRDGAVVNGAQLDALDTRTDLVTIAMGLNNTGLAFELLYQCLPASGLADQCAAELRKSPAVAYRTLDAAFDGMADALAAIAERAPEALVVLVGYPRLLPDHGTCKQALPLPAKAAGRVRGALARTGSGYAEVAAEQGAVYLDMYAASAGHDVCSEDPWVNGDVASGPDGAVLHPTAAFHGAVADRVVELARDRAGQ